ncbi:MAG: hypothetical protein QXD03_01720 [Candidatus Anstonellales archaeon]
MGYYSSMVLNGVIHTDYDIDTIKSIFKDYINTVKENNRPYMEIYNFVEESKGMINIETDDTYAKHYADRELAEFISKIIKEGYHVKIKFIGEDGTTWGYLITKDKIFEIEWVERIITD